MSERTYQQRRYGEKVMGSICIVLGLPFIVLSRIDSGFVGGASTVIGLAVLAMGVFLRSNPKGR